LLDFFPVSCQTRRMDPIYLHIDTKSYRESKELLILSR
jgi:hypothetical protein